MLEFMDGNQALVRGAIDAGCRFFAGYPITPATSILLEMSKELPKVGGVAIQAEDEIAAIGFCIGASMAGWKAMTASAGPGLSLYSENIGMAIMGEAPIVIGVIQRQGPATGSATKVAQADIQFVRWGTSGGLPVIAIYPTTVAECYTFAIHAFNLAERFRAPVFLLSDKELALTRERVDLNEFVKPEVVDRKRAAASDSNYLPYGFDDIADVPAFAEFGGDLVTRFNTSTHDERGLLLTGPEKIQRFIDHYEAKIMRHRDEIAMVRADLEDGADTLVISYGITARSAAEAVAAARRQGKKISHLVVYTIWPSPEKQILEAARVAKRIVVPELNTGQYRLEIERIVGREIEIVGVTKFNTELLSPEEIITRGKLI